MLIRKKSEVNGAELEKWRPLQRWTGKKLALTALNRKNTGVNGVKPEKTALTALNRKNSGINRGELEKSGVNGIEMEKWLW